MTPEEAARHEWLQPSASSTYVSSKSKENSDNQLSFMQKLQRSQPMTPNTILPEIKTPNNRQRYVKERVKGEFIAFPSKLLNQTTQAADQRVVIARKLACKFYEKALADESSEHFSTPPFFQLSIHASRFHYSSLTFDFSFFRLSLVCFCL